MITQQKKLVLSQYAGLYDILVPADHFLRRLHDDIYFSFIYRELVDKYSESMGRTAYDPVMMFKYLILKVFSKLSDDNRIHIRAIIDGTYTVSVTSLCRPMPALKECSKKVYTLLPEEEDLEVSVFNHYLYEYDYLKKGQPEIIQRC